MEETSMPMDYTYDKSLQTPLIVFASREEWIQSRKKLLDAIEHQVWKVVVGDLTEFNKMSYHGFTSKQNIKLFVLIANKLNELTKHQHADWCGKASSQIVDVVDAALRAFTKLDTFNQHNANEIALFVFSTIKCRLGDDKNVNGLLDGMATYPDSK